MPTPKPTEPVALIDMDGTVADFDGQMRADLAALRSPEEGSTQHLDPDDSKEPDWLKARKKLIKSQPGWWRNLPRYEPGFEILDILRELEFTLMVTTKGPWGTHSAWTEKVEWCRQHVPDAAVTVTEDKGLVYGKVLVDDWPAYGIRWLEWRPRGLLVVPAHPWNRLDRFPSHLHPNIFRYTPGSHHDLRERLKTIRSTAG